MIEVLITGINGYIGNSVKNWLSKYPYEYKISLLDVRSESWKNTDFSQFETVIHLAGIPHFSKDEAQREYYNKVNTQLSLEIAKFAKKAGVKQFVFMSSIIVYGNSRLDSCCITKETLPNPADIYGESKLNAEVALTHLASNDFKIAIIRPPMIYGKGSKGNYSKLSHLARKAPLFPNIHNQRSMLHIDNLCEFIKQIIDREEQGLFFPQNREYVCTSDLVKEISKLHGRKIMLTPLFNPFIKLLFKLDPIKKLFGNLIYDKSLSSYDFEYQVRDFKQSIELTENKG